MKRLIAVLLAALMLLGATGCIRISCTMPVRYSNAEKYTAGDFTYEDTKVTKVQIEWLAGSVTLKNGKGTLSVTESGADTLKEEDRMHWWIDGTTLKIKYCKSGSNLSLADMEKKDLTVELPAFVDLDLDVASGKVIAEDMLTLGKFTLDKASGNAEIKYLSAKKVNIDTASGATTLGKVSVSGEFDVDTASGGLTIDEIAADSVSVNSASGGVRIGTITADSVRIGTASGGATIGIRKASTVRVKSTSGGIRITLLDKEAGAKIKYDAVSGNFNTALSVVNSGDIMTIGQGLIDMEISLISGSVTVD